MFDPISSAIGGVASIGGIILQDHYNRRAANQQRDWEKNMSNTSHQREVQDLINAGLNPILSAGGQGASTPQGATMTPFSVNMPSVFEISQMRNDTQRVKNDTQRANNETAVTAANIRKTNTDTDLARTKDLIEKGGMWSKFFGTGAGKAMEGFEKMNQKKSYNPLQVPNFKQGNLDMRGVLP